MELADILSEGSVFFVAEDTTKNELLRLLAGHAAALTGCNDSLVFDAIDSRERLGSTALGNGIAVPHGKVPGLERVHAVFARLSKPIDFDALDDQPVDLVLLLLAPLGAGADHLKALAMVARILRTDSVVERLRSARDVRELRETLTEPLTTFQAA